MFRINSPFGNDTSSYAESIQSSGYSNMDEPSSQVSNLPKPSAKSVYLQRKEYAASINTMMDKFQYRVEHLFTCDLDGKELRSVADCVERLKLLDGMGRVWGQGMLLEVRGPKLLLTDTETKTELESIALADVQGLKAVLNSGAFNSLLTVSVQSRRKHTTAVFMFQCEDVRADFVQRDLSRAISRRKQASDDSAPHWTAPDYEDDISEPELFLPEEEEELSLEPSTTEEEPRSPSQPYIESMDRTVDIFNRILNDIEIFMGQIAAAVAKNGKKKKKKKKGKVMDGMPPAAEFAECLHKMKCAFNLLGELNGKIHNPSAPELVHSLFMTLSLAVSHSPKDLPPTIVAPLLTPECIRLMSEEASTEEDQLWQSLGDAWNIPSTRWPGENAPTDTLELFDGWQPPEVSKVSVVAEVYATPEPRTPVSRQESPLPAPSLTSAKRRPPQPQQSGRSGESKPQQMRVLYDFISRNQRELTVRKGDTVELLDMSKQWWKVRDRRGEEGYVPNNILEAHNEQPIQQTGGPPVLAKKSKSAEVKAWLEYKGFSKITVRCLGVLSGSMLLGMSRDELKTVCPEEGGRVFFQLQAVKSNMAAAS